MTLHWVAELIALSTSLTKVGERLYSKVRLKISGR